MTSSESGGSHKARWRPRAGLFALLIIPVAFEGTAWATASSLPETVYAIGGKQWKESVVRTSYDKVWRHHVVDRKSKMVQPAWRKNAFYVEGNVLGQDSFQRLILRGDSGLFTVLCRNIGPWEAGERRGFMVQRGVPSRISVTLPEGQRTSMPHVFDVTMTFDEFIHALRQGRYRFQELGDTYRLFVP